MQQQGAAVAAGLGHRGRPFSVYTPCKIRFGFRSIDGRISCGIHHDPGREGLDLLRSILRPAEVNHHVAATRRPAGTDHWNSPLRQLGHKLTTELTVRANDQNDPLTG